MLWVAPDDGAIAAGRAGEEGCEKKRQRLIGRGEDFMDSATGKRMWTGQIIEQAQAGFKADFVRGNLVRFEDLELPAMGGDHLHKTRTVRLLLGYSQVRIE